MWSDVAEEVGSIIWIYSQICAAPSKCVCLWCVYVCCGVCDVSVCVGMFGEKSERWPCIGWAFKQNFTIQLRWTVPFSTNPGTALKTTTTKLYVSMSM